MTIDEREKARRREQISQSRERVRLQGIELTPETEELAARYISGELTPEQFVAEGVKLYLPQILKQ